jgi:hypothetical protein
VNAQVRIGGLEDPNLSAILDLNADNDESKSIDLGLALPRVALTSTGSSDPLKAHVKGMIVYNIAIADDVTHGTYYNDGSKWVRLGKGTLTVAPDGGLALDGSGTVDDPHILGIAAGGVTADKLNAMDAKTGQVLMYNGSTWVPVTLSSYCSGAVVFKGAYSGPTVPIAGFTGDFEKGWPNNTTNFTYLDKDLCWAKTDLGVIPWMDANAACAALDITTDNILWRLPNLKELQVLYEAIGETGGCATELSVLDTFGKGNSRGATCLQSNNYWSSTEQATTHVYTFNFAEGARGYIEKEASRHVRCVRTIP